MNEIPLYIHIPFCRNKCSYCAFYSCINHSLDIEVQYINELKKQISFFMAKTASKTCSTLYIGGGTPSLLKNDNLRELLKFLEDIIDEHLQEFTIECNPEDIKDDFIALLNDSSVNRISLGVQSFNDSVLKSSGRIANSVSVESAISLIREKWKGRFSIDIISGLPGQTAEGQKKDIEMAVHSGADHISCYYLIVEENTPFSDDPKLLDNREDEDLLWDICRKTLLSHGFEHYEISNFCKSGCESIHNLQYWKMNSYLGCGPGAVSMIGNDGIQRISTPHDLNGYLQGSSENWSVQVEEIPAWDFIFENYMMGLRTAAGINRGEFYRRFSRYPEQLIIKTIESSPENTFLLSDKTLSLTENARLFMNSILMKISDELETLKIDFSVHWP